MTGVDPALLDDLCQWLRIPSVSTDGGDLAALRQAADWACERITAAGGQAERLDRFGNPLVVGELRAARADAPTVLIYGHADVQGAGDRRLWQSDPFAPEVRDGRLYARGASDDKGNFLPLLHEACAAARAGTLPVHVRVLIDGEEEIAGASVGRWLREDERGADCAVVFDSWMVDEQTPAVTIGLRGAVQAHLTVRTNERDLHSGVYGGSVLNAAHVLHTMIAAVLPGPNGRVRPELRADIEPPAEAERAGWADLPAGDEVLAAAGARALHPRAGATYYERTWGDASLDVGGIRTGAERTVVPAEAHATLSLRLAPSQRAADLRPVLEQLLRGAAPAAAQVTMRFDTADPVLFDPQLPAIALGARAIERATGRRPAIVRWGGGIPVVAELAAAGIPAIVSGFALPADLPHAPNESFRLESLRLGAATARELLSTLARLPAEA